jgi:hypothetical protein
LKAAPVVELLNEAEDVRRRWNEATTEPDRHEAFVWMKQMQTVEFARSQAARLRDALDG